MENKINAPEPKNDKQYFAWCIFGIVSAFSTVAVIAINALKDVFNSNNGGNDVE